MSYLLYWCLFAHSGVQHILCCVFISFVLVLCILCWQFLWIVLFDCSFGILECLPNQRIVEIVTIDILFISIE